MLYMQKHPSPCEQCMQWPTPGLHLKEVLPQLLGQLVLARPRTSILSRGRTATRILHHQLVAFSCHTAMSTT